MLQMDAIRSFVFIALTAAALFAWHLKKLKNNSLIITLGLLILVDLWMVDKRYLNNDNFVSQRENDNPFPEMPADKAIKQDKDLSYRVLPLQADAFMDARTSYHHKSIGGYHAAKLQRYQDMIEHQITPEMQQMATKLNSTSRMDSVFLGLNALNMLNTRYVIYDLNSTPLYNPLAMGNAWFVDKIIVVENADEEMAALKSFNPVEELIVEKRYTEFVQGKSFTKDENGFIELVEYEPNHLKYSTKASSEQCVVFSEIYYNKGWNAYLNGELAPHFRANYILRAMVLPAGTNTLEFKFEPKSYYMGNKVSMASSILFILILLGYLFMFRNRVFTSTK